MLDIAESVGTRIDRALDIAERWVMTREADIAIRADQANGAPAEQRIGGGQAATNGYTYVYPHPADGLEIVARPDDDAPGGFAVTVERA